MTGQAALPVRRYQAERVPAFASPGMCDAVRLQHDVVEPALLQAVTDGEPGLAAADDDHGVVLGGRRATPGVAGRVLDEGQHAHRALPLFRRKLLGRALDGRQLVERRAADEPVTGLNALGGELECRAHALDELLHGIGGADREVLLDHVRRRVAVFVLSVWPFDSEVHFRHLAFPQYSAETVAAAGHERSPASYSTRRASATRSQVKRSASARPSRARRPRSTASLASASKPALKLRAVVGSTERAAARGSPSVNGSRSETAAAVPAASASSTQSPNTS